MTLTKDSKMTIASDSGQECLAALQVNYEAMAVLLLAVELTQGKAVADQLFNGIQVGYQKGTIQNERQALQAALGL